jgi:arylsulfatase A-like enzyme
MSFYTGRYVNSHGAAWNNFPLKVGEQTLGDHLRKLGMQCWLIGKTHMKVDEEGMDPSRHRPRRHHRRARLRMRFRCLGAR